MHPDTGSHKSIVQTFPSSQFTAGTYSHWPVYRLQLPVVQAFASAQVLCMCSHPVMGAHRSNVHGFWSSQDRFRWLTQ